MTESTSGDTPSDLERLTRLPFFAPSPGTQATTDTPHPQQNRGSIGAAAAHLTRAGRRATHPNPMPTDTARPAPATPEFPPAPATTKEPVTYADGGADLPWPLIRQIREDAANALTARLEQDPSLTTSQQEAVTGTYVDDIIRTRTDDQIRTAGRSAVWPPDTQARIRKAVLDGIFRLGRLQPLLEQEDVENIHIKGFDNVVLSLTGGRRKRYPHPIADSDADLMQEVNTIATRTGNGARSFTRATPRLHLDLPGNARLAAIAPPVALRPTIVIRIHRLVDVTLDDLVELETLTAEAADFLRAAVIAGKSIVTSGFPGAGKTTLLRALADCLPPEEDIVTIEMERELHLEQMGGRHPGAVALEYQPGSGEPRADGRKPGEITLEDLVFDTLRLDTQRFVVGEVRGPEIVAMMQAMQSGAGSLSTTHAASANDAITRMSSLMLSKGGNITPQYANRMIGQNVDLIVQVAQVRDPGTGEPLHKVTEIGEVLPGETENESRPVVSLLFEYDRMRGRLLPSTLPSKTMARDLGRAGYSAGSREVS